MPTGISKALAHSAREVGGQELAKFPLPSGLFEPDPLLQAIMSGLAEAMRKGVDRANALHVHRLVTAVDCGMVVNPNTVAAQMEGGSLFGLTAALYGPITLRGGRVEQSNFHDYRPIRINEAPTIETHIVPSGEVPGGIGEAGTAIVSAAVANAIFAASGQRIRTLPFNMHPVYSIAA